MSLKLLVDECLLSKLLVKALEAAGHDAQTTAQAQLNGKPDAVIFRHAIAEKRVILTSNCDDFAKLSNDHVATKAHHPGILLLFLYNNPNKDMSITEIISAISNLETTKVGLKDRTHTLNNYRY